ncbi:hypothetical protein HK097_009927 [Rhizophlyctis rosea]|uniref:Uncharacterized protein n=1 Tax=Rhizophlyctis rosea TaxID=64517 RepID=A0AAD5X8V6_9FUNG|nr:hypothetical protein HK097_009927 [Rhizophlyctis rosea]
MTKQSCPGTERGSYRLHQEAPSEERDAEIRLQNELAACRKEQDRLKWVLELTPEPRAEVISDLATVVKGTESKLEKVKLEWQQQQQVHSDRIAELEAEMGDLNTELAEMRKFAREVEELKGDKGQLEEQIADLVGRVRNLEQYEREIEAL